MTIHQTRSAGPGFSADVLALEDIAEQMQAVSVYCAHIQDLVALNGDQVDAVTQALRKAAAHFKCALASLEDVRARRKASNG